MKTKGKALCSAFGFLVFFILRLDAQVPVFSAPNDTVQYTASRYVANIRVKNFKKLVGVQFTLTWDPQVVALDSAGNFGMPMNYENNFGLMDASKGVMRFAWNEPKLQGADLKDETIMFSLFFRPLGKADAFSPLRFTDDPTVREVVDASFNSIPAEFRHGTVRFKEATVSSVASNYPDQFAFQAVYPNPVQIGQQVGIAFFSRDSRPVSVSVTNLEGKLLFRQKRDCFSGINRLELSPAIFPATGVYFVQLQQGEKFSTQSILFQ
jgi:hypothetical protein